MTGHPSPLDRLEARLEAQAARIDALERLLKASAARQPAVAPGGHRPQRRRRAAAIPHR
jgi:hypothetical protein